jgi:hypothetical protein
MRVGESCLTVVASAAALQSTVHGFHEWFHMFVVLGHLTSMVLDLYDVASPCARVVGPWVLRAAPFNPGMVKWVLSPWLFLFAMLPNKRRLVSRLMSLRGAY